MKILIPPQTCNNLLNLGAWVEKEKPEFISITKDHALTSITGFNPWEDSRYKFTDYRGIPILYSEEAEVEYKGVPIFKEQQ